MRQQKFHKYERVAGIFVMMTMAGIVFVAASVAVKQGWFDTKTYFVTSFATAEGVHSGTVVQMAGLRAGSVEEVDLQPDSSVKVKFYVQGKFQPRIKQDSRAQLIRPFIIGERVLDISVGTPDSPELPANRELASRESIDLLMLLSGKTMSTSLERLSSTLENLTLMMTALTSKNRTQSLVRIFDRLDPLLGNVDQMVGEMTKLSKQATHQGNLQTVVANLSVTTHELNTILPELNRQNPDLARDLGEMAKNLATLSNDFKVLGPALTAVGPDLPQTTKKAVEALNETLVLMKAMQKSLLMRGNVREVREEEAARERLPASKTEIAPSN